MEGTRRQPLKAPRVRGPAPASRRGGTTFLELVFMLTILAFATVIFCGMFLAASNQRAISRESTLSAAAARNVLETMRGEEFEQIFAMYNEDPGDDPGGPGSAPGNRFSVLGLTPLQGALEGMNGRVEFPALLGKNGASQLREDADDDELGAPRDLNGDSRVDAADHADDYILLPVRVRIDWRGRAGERSYTVNTMLSDFR